MSIKINETKQQQQKKQTYIFLFYLLKNNLKITTTTKKNWFGSDKSHEKDKEQDYCVRMKRLKVDFTVDKRTVNNVIEIDLGQWR